MNAHELRRRGLNFVRRRIEAGTYTPADLARWESELGPEVLAMVPSEPRRRTRKKSDDDTPLATPEE